MLRPAEHLRCALSIEPAPEPRPGLWPGRDCCASPYLTDEPPLLSAIAGTPPALHGPMRCPPLPGASLFRHLLLLARAIAGAPPVEHPPARGTMPCAQGAFSLTAMIFRSLRAQKGAWCARERRQSYLNQRSSGHFGRCRLNSPACYFRQARYYRHFTCRR